MKTSRFWEAFSALDRTTSKLGESVRAIRSEWKIEQLKREPAQTNHEKWRALLQELSELTINASCRERSRPPRNASTERENTIWKLDQIRNRLTARQIEARWLGEPPASDEQIVEAERRLGIRLPPSYRAFLKISNGWFHPSLAVSRMASIEEVTFTRDSHSDMVEAWAELAERDWIEAERDLAATLMISKLSDFDQGARLMLNPVRIRDGEMDAWTFFCEVWGADPYPSFWHLMAAQVVRWRAVAAIR